MMGNKLQSEGGQSYFTLIIEDKREQVRDGAFYFHSTSFFCHMSSMNHGNRPLNENITDNQNKLIEVIRFNITVHPKMKIC